MKIKLTLLALIASMSVASSEEVVATLNPMSGSIAQGVLTMEDMNDATVVTAIITGLAPGAIHPVQVHMYGDFASLDGSSAGGPYVSTVRSPVLARVRADDSGVGVLRLQLSSMVEVDSFAGRAIVIYGGEGMDNARQRICAGVLGYANPSEDHFSMVSGLKYPERYELLVSGKPTPEGDLEKVGKAIEDTGEAIVEGVGDAAEETGKALRNIGRAIEQELSE